MTWNEFRNYVLVQKTNMINLLYQQKKKKKKDLINKFINEKANIVQPPT